MSWAHRGWRIHRSLWQQRAVARALHPEPMDLAKRPFFDQGLPGAVHSHCHKNSSHSSTAAGSKPPATSGSPGSAACTPPAPQSGPLTGSHGHAPLGKVSIVNLEKNNRHPMARDSCLPSAIHEDPVTTQNPSVPQSYSPPPLRRTQGHPRLPLPQERSRATRMQKKAYGRAAFSLKRLMAFTETSPRPRGRARREGTPHRK